MHKTSTFEKVKINIKKNYSWVNTKKIKEMAINYLY